jgi:CBF1 interacting corepressor
LHFTVLQQATTLTALVWQSFHPSTHRNQRAKWEAEQRAKSEQKKQEDLQRARDEEISRFRVAEKSGSRSTAATSVSFLYAPPPGYLEQQQRERDRAEQLKQQQQQDLEQQQQTFGTGAPEGSSVEQEDAVLAKIRNAPRTGDYTHDIDITPRPFAVQLRKVRCVRCKKHGHISGDRECEMRDANPNGICYLCPHRENAPL